MLSASPVSLPGASGETMVAPIVGAIGAKAALALFLRFGGSTVYVPQRPQAGSRLVEAIGAEAVAALHRQFGYGHLKVPLANAWIARHLDGEGIPRAEMCRLMRVSRTSLSGYLNGRGGEARAGRSASPRGRIGVGAARA